MGYVRILALFYWQVIHSINRSLILPLTFLDDDKFENHSILSWALAFQEHDYTNTVNNTLAKDNVFVDYISRRGVVTDSDFSFFWCANSSCHYLKNDNAILFLTTCFSLMPSLNNPKTFLIKVGCINSLQNCNFSF